MAFAGADNPQEITNTEEEQTIIDDEIKGLSKKNKRKLKLDT